MYLLVAALVFVLFSTFAMNARAEQALICKNKKVVRMVRVTKESGHCQTIYTKDGKEQTIGSGQNLSSCQKYLEDVRRNLSNVGWKCRDVKDAAVSEVEAPAAK
jgi:hypothetical protein